MLRLYTYEYYINDVLLAGWVDVPWVQSTSAPSQKSNTLDTTTVKVVDISNPDVRAAISEAEKKEGIEPREAKPSNFRPRACRVGRRLKSNAQEAGELENQSNLLRDSGREISADLANLRLLMAVEDLLDNASSDLVASALAEAASLDQLRAASRNLQTSFRQSAAAEKKSSSTQGSRESSSPPISLSATDTESSVFVHQERQPLCETGDLHFCVSSNKDTGQNDDVTGSKLDEETFDKKDTDNSPKETKLERSELNIYVDSSSSAHRDNVSGMKSSDTSLNEHDGKDDDASNDNENAEKKEIDKGFETESAGVDLDSKGNESHPAMNNEGPTEKVEDASKENKESEEQDPKYKHVQDIEDKTDGTDSTSHADVEDKNGFVTHFFDARSDEFSESDKNRQNEMGRELLPGEGDLLFNKNTEVIYIECDMLHLYCKINKCIFIGHGLWIKN